MAQSANCMPVASSDKKISVQPNAIIREIRTAGKKDSRRRISCKELGNGECEGWLWHKEKPGFAPNSWKKYWFMLKDKSLYCYKGPHDVVARRLYHIPAFVVTVATETSRKYAFKISHASFGTVLFATKDYTDMSKWMTHLILSSEEESEKERRKKSDESTGDISESDNEANTEEDEQVENNSLKPIIEKDNETEDKDITCASPVVMCFSDSRSSAVSSGTAACETELMPLAPFNQNSTPVETSEPQSTLLTSSDLKANSIGISEPISTYSSSSKQATEQESSQLLCPQPESESLHLTCPEPKSESLHLTCPEPKSESLHLTCPEPESESLHLTCPEPESTQRSADASLAAAAAKKTSATATLSKPKSSPKTSPATKPSASPTFERLSQARTTVMPTTSAMPLRILETSSTIDSSAAFSAPFSLARAVFETASPSKCLASVPEFAAVRLPKTALAAEGPAKKSFEIPRQGLGPATCAKPSSASIVRASPNEDSAVASITSLSGMATYGPALSANPLAAAPLARAPSATEQSMKQSAASPTNSKRFGPATCAKLAALPWAVSESLPPSRTSSGCAGSPKSTASVATSCTASSSNGDSTLALSDAQSCIVETQSVLEKPRIRPLAVTSQSDNEKEVDIQPVPQNSENSRSRSDRISEISKDETADLLQSVGPLPELSATKRAHKRMTHFAKSIRLRSKPTLPANRSQELCSRLLVLQRSFKDKMQELQILEELLKTSIITSDRLKQFCCEHRDIAKRLTGNSDLKDSFESDMENPVEDVPSI